MLRFGEELALGRIRLHACVLGGEDVWLDPRRNPGGFGQLYATRSGRRDR